MQATVPSADKPPTACIKNTAVFLISSVRFVGTKTWGPWVWGSLSITSGPSGLLALRVLFVSAVILITICLAALLGRCVCIDILHYAHLLTLPYMCCLKDAKIMKSYTWYQVLACKKSVFDTLQTACNSFNFRYNSLLFDTMYMGLCWYNEIYTGIHAARIVPPQTCEKYQKYI